MPNVIVKEVKAHKYNALLGGKFGTFNALFATHLQG